MANGTVPFKSFEELADSAPTIVWMSDESGACVYSNAFWTEFTGQPFSESLGYGWINMIHQDDKDRVYQDFITAKEHRRIFIAEYRLKRSTGEYRWIMDTAAPRVDQNGAYLGYVGGIVDTHEKKLAEEALYLSNERFKAAIEAVEGLIWICDSLGRFVGEQPNWEKLTGQSPEEYKDLGWTKAVHPDNLETFMNAANESLTTGNPFEAEQILRSKDGSYRNYLVKANPVRNPDGTIREWVGVHTDVTDKQQNELHIQHMATHDLLTNLPNRLLLDDRLDHLLNQRANRQHAILFMDLNRFKIVNDSLGHHVGDRVLKSIARRLIENIRPGDTISRYGGDEFIIILEDINNDADVAHITLKLLDIISQPLNIANNEFTVDASVGIALYPRDGDDSKELLKNADRAMYLAKQAGGNTFKFFEKSINTRFAERLVIENDLKNAIRRNELFLQYQPKIDTQTGKVYCFETLVRWNHPTKGLIPPNEFISIAEDIGFINALGNWVLKKACSQLRLWHQMGYQNLRIAINLSVHQLNSPDLMEEMKTIVREANVHPSNIEIEITETRLMENISLYEELLLQLRVFGFTLAIDDFGTGYSSLNYLKRLPITTLKIDRSFINDILDDSDDAAIVAATIGMANKMQLHIVAEGVETLEQAILLKNQNCYCMQGYYFSKPLAPEMVPGFIKDFDISRYCLMNNFDISN